MELSKNFIAQRDGIALHFYAYNVLASFARFGDEHESIAVDVVSPFFAPDRVSVAVPNSEARETKSNPAKGTLMSLWR
jgi:hypothetical protein